MKLKLLTLLFAFATVFSNVSQAAFPVNNSAVTSETQAPAAAVNLQNQTTAANAETPAPIVKGGYSKNNSRGGSGGGLAIASFCCAVVGIFILGLPLGILAIVFGAIALAGSGAMKGFAIAGLALGILDVIFVLAYLASL